MGAFNIKDSWNYYQSLSEDMARTSRYVEPIGQEDVYSIEFSKIIVLSCIELESVFKALCSKIDGSECKNIAEYQEKILREFPRIVDAVVTVPRAGTHLQPFADWKSGGKLSWWKAYTEVKHTRGECFKQASYKNAVSALSALYVSILYYNQFTKAGLYTVNDGYLSSGYANSPVSMGRIKSLPDFEEDQA